MELVYAIITLQALTTALLIYFNKRYKGEDLFLSLLFGVIFIHLFYKGAILMIFQDRELFDKLHGAFSLLYGPMLFLYIQSVLGKTLSTKAFLLHTTPFLMGFGVNVLLTASVLLDMNMEGFMQLYHYFILFSLLFSSFGYGIYPFLIFRKLQPDALLKLKIRISKLIGGAFLMISALIFLGFFIEYFQWSINLGSRYTFVGILLILFFAVINVRMRILLLDQKQDPEIKPVLDIQSKEKYRNSRLEEEEQELVLEKLNHFFLEKKPYLNSDYALDNLAQDLGLPKLKITQALNLGLGQNFYQYLNTARIEESKKLLQTRDEDNFTVIGYESGFKSKSTFYKYFKDLTGFSPSDYKKSLEVSG